MPNLFSILAAATVHGAEEVALAVASEDSVLQKFGIEGPFLLSQIVSFGIVAFILYKFAFKPVLATIDERQRKIQEGLDYTDEMEAKLADAEAQHKEVLQKASREAQKIVVEAKEVAEGRIAESTREAAGQAGDIIKRAKQQIETDRKKMLDDARSEIARLVVATAGKVLSKDLSSDEKNRYAESASSQLFDSQN